MRKLVLATSVVLAIAAPVLADQTTGVVQSFDAASGRLELQDRTIWTLPATLTLPVMAKGDRIDIIYTSAGEAGIVSVDNVVMVSKAAKGGA